MNRKAIIFGVKGIKLTADERKLITKEKPWGIILFSRNIKSIYQLKSLITDIKKCVNDKNYPILIDEEGGNVCRLKRIIDLSFFSQEFFGKLYKNDNQIFFEQYRIYIDTICDIFKKVGINMNTVPVLDIRTKGGNNIIGNRSFSSNLNTVIELGNLCIKLYKKNKIFNVAKHIPGHGLAKSDSHFSTPIIKESKINLIKKDFKAFKMCNSLFAMTAHIIYKSYDPLNTATHSQIIINKVIRSLIGFKGLIITDDISMKALKYGLKVNTTKALDAGCNIILHCNANIGEMKKLVKIVPKVDSFIEKKTSQFYKFLS